MEKSESMPTTQKDDALRTAVMRWWQSMMLSADELKAKNIRPAPSGMKAILRRCDCADNAIMTEGFRALWFSLPAETRKEGDAKKEAQQMECWGVIAASLVFVQENTETTLATAAGTQGEGDKSAVSEMRFAQLQNVKTADEFLRRLRRILKQLKGRVSVVSLAKDIQKWFNEHNEFSPKKADKRIGVAWAMDYYRAAPKDTGK